MSEGSKKVRILSECPPLNTFGSRGWIGPLTWTLHRYLFAGSSLRKSRNNEFAVVSEDLEGCVKDFYFAVKMGSILTGSTFCGIPRPTVKRGQIACMK